MTAISAVIFLVSARYDMSTSYIVGRVENNEYGIAIAYSAVLIVRHAGGHRPDAACWSAAATSAGAACRPTLSQSRTNVSLPAPARQPAFAGGG